MNIRHSESFYANDEERLVLVGDSVLVAMFAVAESDVILGRSVVLVAALESRSAKPIVQLSEVTQIHVAVRVEVEGVTTHVAGER